MKKKTRILIINIIFISMFINTPIANAVVYSSKFQAIKAAVTNSGGTNLKSKSGVHKGGTIPAEYSEYGFGTIKDESSTFYKNATGGSNPKKSYWAGKLSKGTQDKTYVGVYTTGRTVSTAPKTNENHSYYVCYPEAGSYKGTKIDVKGEVEDYSVLDNNAVMAFGKKLSVSVLGLHWIKIKWSFKVSNGSCTGNAITVKGNTSYWDVDNMQGIMIYDDNKGIYIKDNNNKLKYADLSWKDSDNTTHTKPFIYSNSTYDNSVSGNANYGFTETFEGSALTRVYSFYENDGNSNGGIGHSNKTVIPKQTTTTTAKPTTTTKKPTTTTKKPTTTTAKPTTTTVCVPASCPHEGCDCLTGKTCWY